MKPQNLAKCEDALYDIMAQAMGNFQPCSIKPEYLTAAHVALSEAGALLNGRFYAKDHNLTHRIARDRMIRGTAK
jgi:hypothetical protein